MATTQELLDKLKSNLTSIYDKLEQKGVQVEGNKNLDNLVLAIDNVVGGGATTAKLSLADCTQEISEMEGMMANFLWGTFNAPNFDIGSMALSYQGTTTQLDELEEMSLSDFGGPAVPALMYSKEGYAPNGNPYMSALIIGVGASCEGFNMSTGNMAWTEDSSKMCIMGYCAEIDSATDTPIQNPQWYFDYVEVAPESAEQAYYRGLKTGFLGIGDSDVYVDPDAPLEVSKVVSGDIPSSSFSGKRFKHLLSIPSNIRSIGMHAFENSRLEGGISFEKGSYPDYRVADSVFENCYINSALDLGYIDMGIHENAFRKAKIGGKLTFELGQNGDIRSSAFSEAEIPSVNSDEEGTYIITTATEYNSIYLDGGFGNAKKVILNSNIVVGGFDSHKVFTDRYHYNNGSSGGTNQLEELYINTPEYRSHSDDYIYPAGSSLKKLVAPNHIWTIWGGGNGYTQGRTWQLEYLDIYGFDNWYGTNAGTFSAESLTTLIIRKTSDIVTDLNSGALALNYYNKCTIYVPDSLLSQYQEWYSNMDNDISARFRAISELPTEG